MKLNFHILKLLKRMALAVQKNTDGTNKNILSIKFSCKDDKYLIATSTNSFWVVSKHIDFCSQFESFSIPIDFFIKHIKNLKRDSEATLNLEQKTISFKDEIGNCSVHQYPRWEMLIPTKAKNQIVPIFDPHTMVTALSLLEHDCKIEYMGDDMPIVIRPVVKEIPDLILVMPIKR